VSVAIQFSSHALPPFSKNACLKGHEVGVMSNQTCGTKMFLPFEWLGVEKLAAPILELAARSHAQGAALAIRTGEVPLAGFGIV
jgi:hypothetical protein